MIQKNFKIVDFKFVNEYLCETGNDRSFYLWIMKGGKDNTETLAEIET